MKGIHSERLHSLAEPAVTRESRARRSFWNERRSSKTVVGSSSACDFEHAACTLRSESRRLQVLQEKDCLFRTDDARFFCTAHGGTWDTVRIALLRRNLLRTSQAFRPQLQEAAALR